MLPQTVEHMQRAILPTVDKTVPRLQGGQGLEGNMTPDARNQLPKPILGFPIDSTQTADHPGLGSLLRSVPDVLCYLQVGDRGTVAVLSG